MVEELLLGGLLERGCSKDKVSRGVKGVLGGGVKVLRYMGRNDVVG